MLDDLTTRNADPAEPIAKPDADAPTDPAEEELTPEQRRDNVIRLAFGGDERRYQVFCDLIRSALPANTGVVLRGSAVTGRRWKDGAPFDSKGPGTSDLDLTLVGQEAIRLFKVSGFYVPGVHSRPVSEKDPEIAPDLVPLREALMDLVGRPVNIQATRDFVMHLRGDVLGQPYHVVIEKPEEPSGADTAGGEPEAEDRT